MKKSRIALLLCVVLCSLTAKAQNFAINTTGAAADASAILDASATNKGLLIPRVSLTSLTDATTIPTPANSLMVYNTNTALTGGAGYYYNSGTSASPTWVGVISSASTLGQSSTNYFSTASLTLATATVTYIPGFPVTVNVPANVTVLMTISVGAQTTSTSTTGASVVDMVGLVDGAIPAAGCYQRLFVTNNTTYTTQTRPAAFAEAFSLSAGSHTFGVGAYLAGGSTVTAGGNSTSVLQATMTLTFIKN